MLVDDLEKLDHEHRCVRQLNLIWLNDIETEEMTVVNPVGQLQEIRLMELSGNLKEKERTFNGQAAREGRGSSVEEKEVLTEVVIEVPMSVPNKFVKMKTSRPFLIKVHHCWEECIKNAHSWKSYIS